MIPVNEVLPAVLTDILRKAPLTPEKVAFAWRHAAGQRVDRVTTVDLQNGVLRVRARDKTWQREIQRNLALVRPRLEAVLGPALIRKIEVTVGTS